MNTSFSVQLSAFKNILPHKKNINFRGNLKKDTLEIQGSQTKATCSHPMFEVNLVSFVGIEKMKDNYPRHTLENYAGCILGGAIGDALGAPVEFDKIKKIKKIYGENGIVDLELNKNGKAEITDDTQMTIYTADGLIKSAIKQGSVSDEADYATIYNSYLDWFNTQINQYSKTEKGWISNIRDLYFKRYPGYTCINALKSGIMGDIDKCINISKGNGGVMRVAPVGLVYYKNSELAFLIATKCAAMTHSSPDAYLPAGVHASIIANLIQGKNIEQSIDDSLEILEGYKGHENTFEMIKIAKQYAESDVSSRYALYSLCKSPTGDRTIAAAIYCVLKNPENFKNALIMSVNHDGDSDTIGAVTGNIIGACLGTKSIPEKWLNEIELKQELNYLSADLLCKNPNEIVNHTDRYMV